jgi:hypothetical protein
MSTAKAELRRSTGVGWSELLASRFGPFCAAFILQNPPRTATKKLKNKSEQM